MRAEPKLTPRQILAALIGFESVSDLSNLDLVDWVQDYLQSFGIECHRHWHEGGQKAALMAHAGPWLAGGVLLSGHSDVVPVAGQLWTSDPWTLTEREGRLYGRGTCDMKSYVALAIWALAEAQTRGVRRPLQLALSFDEEVGCTGAPPMIAAMQDLLPKAAIALIGEPSNMRLITGHKGGSGFHVHVKGFEVHSSMLPSGVSAVMEAARLIQWVNDQNAALRAQPPSALAAPFDPPFTTLHVGQISGGTAHNITAADCRFAIELRVPPGDDLELWADRIKAEAARIAVAMQQVRPQTGITLTRFFGVPALQSEPQGAAEALVRALSGDNGTAVVSYGTEAGQFQAAGYSAVVCGPGAIAQAHQPDEYLTLAEFEKGHGFMRALLDHLA